MSTISAFGRQLRQHRKKRNISQLALAHRAGSTPRYISFIETGRSRPGKDIILRIAAALGLTLRESNALCVAAGLPIAFTEKALDTDEMKPVRRVIDKVLEQHEPFPAWVIGPGLRFLASNKTAEKVFPGLVGMQPRAVIDMWCAPANHVCETHRTYIVQHTLMGLRQEALHHPHPDVDQAIKHVEQYAQAIKTLPALDESAVMCPTLMINGQQVNTLTTVMRFDNVIDVTMAELRLELVFPADEQGEAIFRSL